MFFLFTKLVEGDYNVEHYLSIYLYRTFYRIEWNKITLIVVAITVIECSSTSAVPLHLTFLTYCSIQ